MHLVLPMDVAMVVPDQHVDSDMAVAKTVIATIAGMDMVVNATCTRVGVRAHARVADHLDPVLARHHAVAAAKADKIDWT